MLEGIVGDHARPERVATHLRPQHISRVVGGREFRVDDCRFQSFWRRLWIQQRLQYTNHSLIRCGIRDGLKVHGHEKKKIISGSKNMSICRDVCPRLFL